MKIHAARCKYTLYLTCGVAAEMYVRGSRRNEVLHSKRICTTQPSVLHRHSGPAYYRTYTHSYDLSSSFPKSEYNNNKKKTIDQRRNTAESQKPPLTLFFRTIFLPIIMIIIMIILIILC